MNNGSEVKDSELCLLRLLEPGQLSAPHHFYKALRAYEPVHWDPYMHAWVVTGYPEVVSVLRNYSADRTPPPEYLDRLGLSFMKPFAEMMLQQMMFMDGSVHVRLRSICSAAFTPARVENMRTTIGLVADQLIDKVIASGQMDLIEDFAGPFPAIVTATLLGVPIEDHRKLGAWILDIAEVLGNFQHHPDRVAEIVRSLQEMQRYVSGKMDEERAHPTDGLIHALMMAEVEGKRLTDEEIVANTIITLIGGHETTTNLIANGLYSLLQDQESLRDLRCHPEIIGSAVEELLRFESPVQHTARIAPCDGKLGERSIQKGARVVAVLAAANRDPNRFTDPDRLDLRRPDNRHLAFGWASHFCFGAPLARMEGQIAFTKLLARLGDIALIDQPLQWRDNAGLRGLMALHIKFTPSISNSRV